MKKNDSQQNYNIERTYSAQGYVKEKYGLSDIVLQFNKNIEMPYYGCCFARKIYKDSNDSGEYESFWKEDQEKNWEDTLAYKILKDSENGLIIIGKQAGIIHDEKTSESKYATNYYLTYYDKNSRINYPSIATSISDAINVNTKVTIEFLFGFDDGFILPVYKKCNTGGSYSMSFSDIIKDSLDDLEDCGFGNNGDTFFFDCPNVEIDEGAEEIRVQVSSEAGFNTYLSFSNDRYGWNEIKRALCSVRIVEFKEEIE